MNKIFLVLVFTLLFSTQGAHASPLSEARASGKVVELANGYVKAQSNAGQAIHALVQDVNSRRKVAYGKIAKKNGIPIETVAKESYKKRVKN